MLLPYQGILQDQVAMCLNEIVATGRPRGMLLIGRSGSGKTYSFHLLEALMPSYRVGLQRMVPFCWISLRAASNPASLCRQILSQLGKPESQTQKLKAEQLEAQVLKAMDDACVLVLAIEEFHNALLKSDSKFRGLFSRLIKNLWNADGHRKRLLLISGTDEIVSPFDNDDELNSRFSIRIYSDSLWFDSRDGTRSFAKVARSMGAEHGIGDIIDFDDKLMIARLLFACRSHLRRLDTLFSRVATLRPKADTGVQGSALVSMAFEQVLANIESGINPFKWSDGTVRTNVRVARGLPPEARNEPQ